MSSLFMPSLAPPTNVHSNLDQDRYWMREALALGRQAMAVTAPNPRVGCLIVRDGQVLGSGVTQAAGQAHAEVMALRDAARGGVDVAGATFYVTLEPCSHHGRTPPCVEAILATRPARVVVAMADPNPLVAGRGLARLRAAGVAVRAGVCAEEALALNPGFVARMTRGTPWVWVKSAASLDGHTALPDGQSRWITGADARQDGQHWRARSCVVLTGIGTVLADDPLLTVRDIPTPRPPVRAVIDSQLRLPLQARMLDGDLDGNPLWLFVTEQAHKKQADKAARLAERAVQVVPMPSDGQGRVHLPAVLQWLGRHDINEVHVEAGATLGGALVQADCVDALLVYLAPTLLGQGRGMLALPVLETLGRAAQEGGQASQRRFEFVELARVGADIRLYAQRTDRWQALLSAVAGKD